MYTAVLLLHSWLRWAALITCLLALARAASDAGSERSDAVERSLAWLRAELTSVRTPLSTGWGVLGLSAWRAAPGEASAWLEETAVRERPADPVHDALLVLAATPHAALFERRPEGA